MDKAFSPADIEHRTYGRWEELGLFAPSGHGPAFSIVIPPPNVTGTLHMGHAFQDTIMDALTRHRRMQGFDTLWQPGTDHAGIATQMVVERQLNAAGVSRLDLGREEFIARVWKWKAESGGIISTQLRRLGASVDWSRDRFTMDPGLSRVVIGVFVRLYRQGLIYRGARLVNWDPVLKTALSDLEVTSAEESGSLWHLRYPLAQGGEVIVATTRPETLFGDAAVAVHPDDERFRHLIGARVKLPLTQREIPIIADEYVDPEFGSGCVKITPAHDFNDYDVGLRHGLERIDIFTPSAALNERVPPAYRALDRFVARERVVADLQAQGFVAATTAHTSAVPRGDRTGEILEPRLTDQWFVRIQPLADAAVAAVKDGRIRFVPEAWSKVYFDWMHQIKDWCISRQLWWGHRIPAWYDPQGAIHVGATESEARAAGGLSADVPLRQDEDVLDTWFSSALWPFSTLGWPEKTSALARFYPTSVLVTGFDIIFFWVARMIMMGLELTGEVPFRDVYVHGLIRDHDGQKMSKSKGNVIDPLDVVDGIELQDLLAKRTAALMQPQMRASIERSTRKQFPQGIAAYGTDALRLTFASLATQSRDLRFDMARVASFRNFCNKLWNAARFVSATLQAHGVEAHEVQRHGVQGHRAHGSMAHDAQAPTLLRAEPSLADRWINSRLSAALLRIEEGFENYRLDLVAAAAYEFIWDEFCDWYLEMCKAVLYSDDASREAKLDVCDTMVRVLETSLRALHPIAPFITEELWQRVAPLANLPAPRPPSIMQAPFPRSADFRRDDEAERDMNWLQGCILGIRQIRGEMDISPAKPLTALLRHASEAEAELAARHTGYVRKLAGLDTLRVLGREDCAPISAIALSGSVEILVPMEGLIEPRSELGRVSKRRSRAAAELQKVAAKLEDPSFCANAPAEVVSRDRARADELRGQLAQLEAHRERVEALLAQ